MKDEIASISIIVRSKIIQENRICSCSYVDSIIRIGKGDLGRCNSWVVSFYVFPEQNKWSGRQERLKVINNVIYWVILSVHQRAQRKKWWFSYSYVYDMVVRSWFGCYWWNIDTRVWIWIEITIIHCISWNFVDDNRKLNERP